MDDTSRRTRSRVAVLLAVGLALLAASCSRPDAATVLAPNNWDALVWDAGNWQ